MPDQLRQMVGSLGILKASRHPIKAELLEPIRERQVVIQEKGLGDDKSMAHDRGLISPIFLPIAPHLAWGVRV